MNSIFVLAAGLALANAPAAELHHIENFSNLFVWSDTCNSYLLKDGEEGLLINLGDGTVLDHLAEAGVKRLDWILFTDHHREQCQGAAKIDRAQTKVGAPEVERALFEHPSDFRKLNVRLTDAYTIHGASYVRPPVTPIHLDQGFRGMDLLKWKGHEIWCLDTRGTSPGGMSYLVKENGKWLAFSGDLMLEDSRMHTWFDSEWDYGFASGIYALVNSASLVASFDPAWLLPSHGRAIPNAKKQLEQYQTKLRAFQKLYVRGYEIDTYAPATQDLVSKPTSVPHVWQVLPHVYKFKGPNFFPNFYLILSDSGHGLAVDCGLLQTNFLDTAIEGMRDRLGLKQIDAIIPTHMHGDHFLQAPYLREKWGAQIWAIDKMGPVCEHPEWFDYSAPIQAYGIGVDRVKFDRLFKPGESFDWEGYHFQIDWMPGQTEFALCVQGIINGRKVAFTGDNIFGNPNDPAETGHEAMVAHNSAILEEGYIYGAEYLSRLKPDILLGGHSYVMDHPARFIERYRKWSYQMRDAFQALSSTPDYRYWFDPFWVRVQPYRTVIHQGETQTVDLHLRNFLKKAQEYEIRFHTPPGLKIDPPQVKMRLDSEDRRKVPIRISTEQNSATGVRIVGLDITLDGVRKGEMFDFVVSIK
jgi:glyoxylase-like metal-dependent hydrolase (beta-lactamase superfamily II)